MKTKFIFVVVCSMIISMAATTAQNVVPSAEITLRTTISRSTLFKTTPALHAKTTCCATNCNECKNCNCSTGTCAKGDCCAECMHCTKTATIDMPKNKHCSQSNSKCTKAEVGKIASCCKS